MTTNNPRPSAPGGAMLARGDAAHIPLPDASVDLVFGSPPYSDARTYGIGAQRDCRSWVAWMLDVTAEAVRVSRGLVLWVCAGVTRDHCYWPACEGLLWEWWSRGGQCWRPAYWHRVGIPGSGGKKWLRADVEYVLCFKGEGNDFWTDNTAMGRPPKFKPGGVPSHRLPDGTRANLVRAAAESGRTLVAITRRKAGRDTRDDNEFYVAPEIANPGTLISTGAAGGGNIGSILAHENEAPFPEALAEFFIKSFCPPGGIVLDPFSGSGTTVAVAARHDRIGLGFDIRQSQCELGTRRLAESLRPVSKLDVRPVKPMNGQGSLFDFDDARAAGEGRP